MTRLSNQTKIVADKGPKVSRFSLQITQRIVLFFQIRIRLILTFFVAIHILLAVVIGDSVILAPDEGGYVYTFKNLYGDSEDPNPQFSSGWISAPKIFLFLIYFPAKVFTLFGLSDLMAVRLLSVMVTSMVFYGVIFLASRNPSKKPDKTVSLSLGVFFIPSIFLWTTVGLREAFIIWALFICFFGLFRYFSNQSFLNLIVITFGFYSLLSIKSYLWAGASLALVSLVFLTFLKKFSLKKVFSILISAVLVPVVLFSLTSTPYALNFIVNPDLSSAANRSGDSITVLYKDSVSGKLSMQKSNENDIKVVFHGDYTAVAIDGFINSNPDSMQSKLLNSTGIARRIHDYVQSKITSSSSKSEPTATVKIDNDFGHIIKPGNLNNLASLIQPTLLFVFGNAPLTQDGSSLFRSIAAAESPLWWLFYSLVLFSLFSYRKRNWLENPILIYSLVLTIGYIVMSAITEVNFGTAFRHRSIIIIPLIFIILATRNSFQNENLKKNTSLEN